ncbi:MAG: hypothetical protein QGH11_05245 [Pirellulaceae bacterium]|nr:hypothetical protein [Pirellulaceae bacterium]
MIDRVFDGEVSVYVIVPPRTPKELNDAMHQPDRIRYFIDVVSARWQYNSGPAE